MFLTWQGSKTNTEPRIFSLRCDSYQIQNGQVEPRKPWKEGCHAYTPEVIFHITRRAKQLKGYQIIREHLPDTLSCKPGQLNSLFGLWCNLALCSLVSQSSRVPPLIPQATMSFLSKTSRRFSPLPIRQQPSLCFSYRAKATPLCTVP